MRLTVLTSILLFLSSIVCAEGGEGAEKETYFLINREKLDSIFERLYQLEQNKKGKINVVHLGDSHVQADFFTNVVRDSLQQRFGDGGTGFTFPYSMVRTNGSKTVKYISDANWNSRLNVSPATSAVDIGLSGIGLYTSDTVFALQLSLENKAFSSIKVFSSTEKPQFDLSLTANDSIKYEIVPVKKNRHKISSGENLSIIASRYRTTVAALKRENGLKSDNIRAGQYLNIPSSQVRKNIQKIVRNSYACVDAREQMYVTSYVSDKPLNKITLLPKQGLKGSDLSGIILENDRPGVLCHTIGVNGAKASDFNKLPLFFEQLNVMKPDLVILSFGTNESFQRLSADQFVYNLRELISRIRRHNPHASILITTPPPSLMRRRNSNTLLPKYVEELKSMTDFPIWDLYSHLDGEKGIKAKGKYIRFIARDKIHYIEEGYELQAGMFITDFLQAYNDYKKKREER